MNTDFLITKISRIVMVDRNEYPEKVTIFKATKCQNELIFHFSGQTTVQFNSKTLYTSENTIRFLPAGNVFEYSVTREKWGECILVAFDSDSVISDEAFTLKIQNSNNIGNLFKKIFSIWVAKDDGYYFECMSLLYKIFAELQKQNYIPENQFLLIKPAIEYIEKHFFDKKITAEDLASCCTISYTYIKKIFIKKFGIPPIKYSIQLKINFACDLLKSEMYSISQVAEICGYKDVYFFSRQFKEYMGISPTDFINKYKSSK